MTHKTTKAYSCRQGKPTVLPAPEG